MIGLIALGLHLVITNGVMPGSEYFAAAVLIGYFEFK